MSRTSTMYTINHAFTTTDKVTNLHGLLDKLVKSNANLSMREIETTDENVLACYGIRYTPIPKIELRFAVGSDHTYIVYTLANIDPDAMTDVGSSSLLNGTSGYIKTEQTNANIIVSVLEVDDSALYVSMNFDGYNRVDSVSTISFLLSPWVNQFTNESIQGVWTRYYGNAAGSTAYYTEKSALSVLTVTQGGSSYPIEGSVAAPVRLKSSNINFYGSPLASDFLYRIYNKNTLFTPGTNLFKTNISGHTFVHIMESGLFARID